MDLHFISDSVGRIIERKKTLILFDAIYLVCMILGACFWKSASTYEYLLSLCDRFVRRICFSDCNLFLVFLERTAGRTLLIALMLASGIHWGCLWIAPVMLLYRAYTFGSCVIILFSVYRLTGIFIVFALYLPVHLCIDVLLISAAVLSCQRVGNFRFCRNDFYAILRDFGAIFLLICAISALEIILLGIIFHPAGNLI